MLMVRNLIIIWCNVKKRPKEIKIGCFTYKVKYKRTTGKNLGLTDLSKKQITIWKHDNKEVLRETLMHEILHVLMEDVVASVEEKKDLEDKEEAIVRLVNPRLFQVFKDNPNLVEFLFKA